MTNDKEAVEGGKVRKLIISPRGFLIRGALIVGVFVLCELAGLREYAGRLIQEPTSGLQAPTGSAYLLAYTAFLFAAPVLLLGGVFFLCVLFVFARDDTPRR